MATQIGAGVILRRGADKLTAAELKLLIDKREEVDRIIADIEARRAVYLEVEAGAKARISEAGNAEARLVEERRTLDADQAALEKAAAESERAHADAASDLARRAREVVAKETALVERSAALDARHAEIEVKARDMESEMQDRENMVQGREEAVIEKELALVKRANGLDAREQRLNTVAGQVKAAVAGV